MKQQAGQARPVPPTFPLDSRPKSSVVDELLRTQFQNDGCLFLEALHNTHAPVPAACAQMATNIVDRLLAKDGLVRTEVEQERLLLWQDELSKELQRCEDRLRKKNMQRHLPKLHKACFDHLVNNLDSVRALHFAPGPLISASLHAMGLPDMNVTKAYVSRHVRAILSQAAEAVGRDDFNVDSLASLCHQSPLASPSPASMSAPATSPPGNSRQPLLASHHGRPPRPAQQHDSISSPNHGHSIRRSPDPRPSSNYVRPSSNWPDARPSQHDSNTSSNHGHSIRRSPDFSRPSSNWPAARPPTESPAHYGSTSSLLRPVQRSQPAPSAQSPVAASLPAPTQASVPISQLSTQSEHTPSRDSSPRRQRLAALSSYSSEDEPLPPKKPIEQPPPKTRKARTARSAKAK